MNRWSNLLWYPRVILGLARRASHPLTLQESRALVRRRLETRPDRFLAFAARYIYGHAGSPYLPLLHQAGCAEGDLRVLVRSRGVERALEALRDAGVYLSFEEFKGREPVVRSGRTFHFTERDFDNPFGSTGFETQSGGTRSRGTPVTIGLGFMLETFVPSMHLALEALGAGERPCLVWLPGMTPERVSLLFMFMGRPLAGSFSLSPPHDAASARRTRALQRATRLASLGRGVKLRPPVAAPFSRPERVLRALLGARDRQGGCVLFTSPSAAVRLAGLAKQEGVSLEGVHFLVTMEPLTAGKSAEIRRAGATAGALYAFTEGGMAAVPCGDPSGPDDMHLMHDSFALIPRSRTVADVPVQAYMFTSLAESPPKIMLNVESDDFGGYEVRRCRCPLDPLGLHHHLSGVRSFSKLTGEGATILGTDCVRILEEVLPREFGGQSVDYQLLEAEDENHLTRLLLLISPEIGLLDEGRVRKRFLEELQRTPARGLRLWQQAETIRVVRRKPVATLRGKVLPFHTQAAVVPEEHAAAST